MKKHLLSKLLLLSALLGGANSVFADYEPAGGFTYLNTFDDATEQAKTTIHGTGSFSNEGGNFGYVFQNAGGALRTNYLTFNQDFNNSNTLFTHASNSQQLTIGFWVNKKSGTDTYSDATPLFSAYSSNTSTSWPMFVCRLAGTLQVNCAGWCDFTDAQNDKKSNDLTINWINDNKWHYYTVTIATNPLNVNEQYVKVYIDGVVKNSWTLNSVTEGQNIKGLLNLTTTSEDKLAYVCLGGNQSWDWSSAADQDPAFAFDDFMVTNKALSIDEINEIITDKSGKEYTVDGIVGGYSQKSTIGQSNKSGGFFDNPGNSFVIKKGQTYKLNFKNSGTSSEVYYNWIVKFVHGGTDYFARSDWWAANGANWRALVGTFTDRHKASTDGGKTTGSVNWDTFKSVMSDIADVDLTITYTSGGDFKIQGTSANGDNIFYYDYSLGGFTNDITVTLGHELAYLTDVVVSAVANTGANGITTFSSSYHLNLDGIAGATAYSVLEAGEGLFLKGEANAEVTIPLSSAGSAISGNMLVGSPVASTIDDLIIDYDNIYVLGASDGKLHNVATYVSSNTLTIPACKAFLRYSGDSNARDLSLIFDDAETTGIQAVEKKLSDNALYFDLMGRRIAQPTKGLYIVNGKKIIVK